MAKYQVLQNGTYSIAFQQFINCKEGDIIEFDNNWEGQNSMITYYKDVLKRIVLFDNNTNLTKCNLSKEPIVEQELVKNNTNELETLSIDNLKALCKKKGISTAGNPKKETLISKLKNS